MIDPFIKTHHQLRCGERTTRGIAREKCLLNSSIMNHWQENWQVGHLRLHWVQVVAQDENSSAGRCCPLVAELHKVWSRPVRSFDQLQLPQPTSRRSTASTGRTRNLARDTHRASLITCFWFESVSLIPTRVVKHEERRFVCGITTNPSGYDQMIEGAFR